MKPHPCVLGKRTALRPIEKGDLAFLHRLRNDFPLQKMLMSQPRSNARERVKAWVDRLSCDSSAALFLIVAAGTGQPLGYAQLKQIDLLHGTADLGICLASEAQGKGHASDAMRLLEDYGADVFRLRKILLHVLGENTRAVGLYRKNGYREVGVLRQHFYQQRQYKDVVLMEKFLEVDIRRSS